MSPKRTLTLDEIVELDGEQYDKELKRSLRNAWKSAANYKKLALQLGVGGLFNAESRIQGEYVCGPLTFDWHTSKTRRTLIDRITEKKDLPVILINLHDSFTQNGVPAVIAHEIGHHLDNLANGFPNRTATQRFVSAFERAGLREYTNERNDLFSELIAETLGQYLRGHKLNAVLLAEVKKVLVNLTRKDQRILQDFRNKQTKQNEGRN